MSSHVPLALRQVVAGRSGHVCEYCLFPEADALFEFQIEHVISEKHGGPTEEQNLAYACVFCNRHKGSDIASLSPTTGQLVRLFNPRTDRWDDHFDLNGPFVVPRTEIARSRSGSFVSMTRREWRSARCCKPWGGIRDARRRYRHARTAKFPRVNAGLYWGGAGGEALP